MLLPQGSILSGDKRQNLSKSLYAGTNKIIDILKQHKTVRERPNND